MEESKKRLLCLIVFTAFSLQNGKNSHHPPDLSDHSRKSLQAVAELFGAGESHAALQCGLESWSLATRICLKAWP